MGRKIMPEMTVFALLLLLVCGGTAWAFGKLPQPLQHWGYERFTSLGKLKKASQVSEKALDVMRQATSDVAKFHFEDIPALDAALTKPDGYLTFVVSVPRELHAEHAELYWEAFATALAQRCEEVKRVPIHPSVWKCTDQRAEMSLWW